MSKFDPELRGVLTGLLGAPFMNGPKPAPAEAPSASHPRVRKVEGRIITVDFGARRA